MDRQAPRRAVELCPQSKGRWDSSDGWYWRQGEEATVGRECKMWILTDPLAGGRTQEKGEALQPSLPAWAKFPPQTILHPVSCSDPVTFGADNVTALPPMSPLQLPTLPGEIARVLPPSRTPSLTASPAVSLLLVIAQSLCTDCSLCLECFPPLGSLPHLSSGRCSNVPFSGSLPPPSCLTGDCLTEGSKTEKEKYGMTPLTWGI